MAFINYLEKNFGIPDQPLKPGTEIPTFTVCLSNGKDLDIETLLLNGPVLINFIKGTWCMFCRAHMGSLIKWQESTKKNISILVISNESVEVVKQWKEKSNVTHLMGCDPEQKIINSFGLGLSEAEYSRPATFLIDSNRVIRMAHYEKRTPAMLEEMKLHLEGMKQKQIEKAKAEELSV